MFKASLFLINLFFAKLYIKYSYGKVSSMGRKKVDRSNKVMQTFESTKPLTARLKVAASGKNITVSAMIRYILEAYFENREL
jgi:hypothetical protein